MITNSALPAKISSFPTSALGFTAIFNGTPDTKKRGQQAINRLLIHFPAIKQITLNIGLTELTFWGKESLENCVFRMKDESLLLLIGSPAGNYTWAAVEENIMAAQGNKNFIPPWDGRVILLKISANGTIWTVWNDWLGSIPIFHTQIGSGQVVTTLEPVIVDIKNPNSADIFLPGLLSLLINGHYISDWTLFKQIYVCPPDSQTQWEPNHCEHRACQTIAPTDKRWEYSWDDLVDEMYELTKQTITSELEDQNTWIIPLSSGLDSRLIAGFAATSGKEINAFTYGQAKSLDGIYAREIAKSLSIPWKHIDIEANYLIDFNHLWASIFGSSLYFHGMYMMQFLSQIQSHKTGKIISGFLGDILSGDRIIEDSWHKETQRSQVLSSGWNHWDENELDSLINVEISDAVREVKSEIQKEIHRIPGAWFQKMQIFEIWTRQRFFTNFQSILCDYFFGVSTPYINRAYANFCFSLPRAALDHRMLLGNMFKRYFGVLSTIPGTYAREPFTRTGRYLVSKRLASAVPNSISKIIFPGFQHTKLNMDITSVKKNGKLALDPLFEKMDLISKWMNPNLIEETYNNIINKNDRIAVRKLQTIQTFAYRI